MVLKELTAILQREPHFSSNTKLATGFEPTTT